MNTSTVVSLPVAADLSALGQHVAVKMTATGVNVVTAVGDKVLGTLLHPNLAPQPVNGVTPSAVGMACTVFLASANGIHYVKLGAGITTAIAVGDEIELDTSDGCYCKKTAGTAVGIAIEAAPSSSAGAIIRAILYAV